jgi:hypothetical protein
MIDLTQAIDLTNDLGETIREFVVSHSRDKLVSRFVINISSATPRLTGSFTEFYVALKEEVAILLPPFRLSYVGNLYSAGAANFLISADILTQHGKEKSEYYFAYCSDYMKRELYEDIMKKKIADQDFSCSLDDIREARGQFGVYVMDVDVQVTPQHNESGFCYVYIMLQEGNG